MNLHKLSKRHSIHSMQQQAQQPGRQPPDEPSTTMDAGASTSAAGGASKPRKKGKFRLKERSSSSVRERFVNDPAYTEDVRHLALPMRRNSGPENVDHQQQQSRKFYTIPKKKSNSVGKDYLRGSGFSVDAADVGKNPGAAHNVQVKVRRKKYNYHNSSEMLRLNADESSSSDNLRSGAGSGRVSALDRRGRSLDRKSAGEGNDGRWFEREGEDEGDGHGKNRNLIRRQNAAVDEGMSVQEDGDEDGKEGRSKLQIGKRFLKGEIGIKSFNYYLLKEGLKSSKKNLLKQRSEPAEAIGAVGGGGLSKSEENIYEEIYFEEKPNDPSDEKIQFIDCELCVQQCNNSNCEACHSHVSKHKLQQHHHHQQKQSDKQNVYEQLKQVPPPQGPVPGPQHQSQYKATVKSLDIDDSSMYHSSSSTYGTATGNVLQYQSYNPNNPNVFKIETTPVAFGCEYNPIQQIYYKSQYGTLPGAPGSTGQQRHHIYQQPQNLVSTNSDFYQEMNRKKSSSSSDSLQARMQRELYQQANLYYYQREAAAAQNVQPQHPSKIYKTSSNASILSETSARSENSLKQPRTGNMSDSSLGDSLFSYPANRRYFGSSESCRFASECRRCSLDVDKCSFSDTCRYDCRNCDCSSSYFSSDFDDTGIGRKSHSRQSGNNLIQDNYNVPSYAEDFMKHVSNVKRNQLGTSPYPQHPQQKQTPSGKIYETPTTYAGITKKTPSQQEHTYEKLKSNPKGNIGIRATHKYDENTKLSISQSHELLLSPSRSKILHEGRYGMAGIERYGPNFSSTLPASIPSKAKSSEFGPLFSTIAREVDTPAKSVTATGPPRATLSNLNHDYAEITQLPTAPKTDSKEQKQTPPPPLPPTSTHPKRSSLKYMAPQPPKPTQTQPTPPGNVARRQAPPIPLNPPLDTAQPITASGDSRDKSLPRRDRADFERSKRGAAAAVAATIQDVVAPALTPQSKRKQEQPQQQHQQQSSVPKKEAKKKVQQQAVEDDGNFTDDEDDEVFLSDKVVPEKPKYGSVKQNPPPKEHATTNKTPLGPAPTAASGQAVTGSNFTSQPLAAALAAPSSPSSSSSIPSAPQNTTSGVVASAASNQPAPPTAMSRPKHREHQPETPATTLVGTAAGTHPATKQLHSNESESLRSSAAAQLLADAESMSDLVRKSDEPATAATVGDPTEGGDGVVGGALMVSSQLHQWTKTKSSPEALSTDLAVSGEASEPALSGRLAASAAPAAAGCSNRENKNTSSATSSHPQTPAEANADAFTASDHRAESAKEHASNDECDISDFPLPEIPVKQDPTSSDNSFLTATEGNDTAWDDAQSSPGLVKRSSSGDQTANFDLSRTSFEGQEMHYRNSNDKPTYLFGENLKKNEIFLNKSGWVQVSQPPHYLGDRNIRAKSLQSELPGPRATRKFIEYNENRYGKGSKLEDLINRNEARRSQVQKVQRQDNVTILKIDPQLSSGGRPLCLPIKRNLADNSPPPVTPILSPPPAFQDSAQKTRLGEIKPGTRIFLSVVDNENRNPKGMVFSRSFEYDNRRYTTPIATSQQRPQNQSYLGNFSKSFDFDSTLIAPMPKTTDQPFIRRNKSPTPAFSTLTGNSPNYLTKKEKPNAKPQLIAGDKSPIFPKAIPGSSVTSSGYESLKRFGDKHKSFDSQMMSSSVANAILGHRSRRSQFSIRANSTVGVPCYGFRSDSVGNARLNSCDSGARSDYSNDGVEDDEENVSDDQSSSLALSYKSSTSYMNQMKGRAGLFGSSGSGNTLTAHSALKPQRSLTPERLYDNDEYGSIRNLKKQRSLTPEKRSRTPDDRSKPRTKGDINSSQSSLVSRQSSGSRSSTLERRYDEAYMRTSSRSSSSSSYSGDEAHASSYRRSQLRGSSLRPTNVAGDYKIRRSRSLQLSERSPSRQQVPVAVAALPHKVVVRLGNVPNKERPAYTSSRKLTGSQLLTQQPDTVYPRISPSCTLDRLRRETASHTIVDVQDKSKSFDNNNYGAYEYEYDKSKSFDENFGVESDKRGYVATEGRSFSHDRIFGSTGTSSSNEYSQSSTSRNRSPQSYGSRLYDHDLQSQQQYDVSRMSRSPIINYNQRRAIARERSPVPGASKPLLGQHYQKPSDLYLMRSLGTPDSEYDDRITPDFADNQAPTSTTIVAPTNTAAAAAAFKEAELVKKFLYATKNKQLQRESRNVVVPPAGTPSTGSCTASSCDFWPHCGVTSTLSVEQNQLTKSGSENCLNRRSIGAGGDISSCATGLLSTGSGTGGEVIVIGASSGATLVPIKANSYGGVGHHPLKKQKNIEIHDRDLATVIGGGGGGIGGGPQRYIYGASRPAIVKANSITFLGEHEMPITRDRVSKSYSHQGSTTSTTTTATSAILTKQNSTSSKSNYSLSDQALGYNNNNHNGRPVQKGAHHQNHPSSGGSGGGGGGSSNSSVKSNSSNYKVNRSPSNKSNPPGPSGNNQRYGAGGGTANPLSTDKAGSGSDVRDRKSRPTYSASTKPHRTSSSSSSSIKRKFEMKLKSRSLPKSFMRYSNLMSDDLELSAIFSPNSPLQLRAVSSPSLTEPTPPAAVLAQPDGNHVAKIADSRNHQHKTASLNANQRNLHHSQHATESVLQKFKKTFSQFKPAKAGSSALGPAHSNSQSSSTSSSSNSNHPHHLLVNSNGMSVDGGSQDRPVLPPPQQQQQHHQQASHRFGPLIWRSSKERRKTKSHRRDKCNSGDSGIQVELEADEQLLPEAGIDGTDPISPSSVTVRRANSAKVSTSSGGASLLKHKLSLKSSNSNNKENIANISRLSGKSRSQPSGLDRLADNDPDDNDARLSESDSDNDDEPHHPGQRRSDPRLAIRDSEPVFAEVLFSFRPVGPQELALEKGALVEVLRREAGPWWWGRIKSDAILTDDRVEEDRAALDNSDCGWFPMDFVKLLPAYNKPKQIIIINNSSSGLDEAGGVKDGDMGQNCDMLQEGGATTMLPTEIDGASVPNESMGGASQEQTKENVIKELLETEINFVKLLNSLCLGYIKPLREREDVFPTESVNIIFSNLEKIWRFQQTFLDALRIAVPNNRIGEVFLEYQSAFMIYSVYCNSYPRALMELENYTNNKEACAILESCRVSQNLPELPLSAHLLAPIQRICRYPLHLSELVKHSPTRKELLPLLNLRKCTKSDLETMDCQEVFELALTAMRRVTEMVNEGKRHSEYLSRMQSRFENFQGPSINVHSTRLFLQTDAIRMTPNLWNNTYTLFLFDRQLIYCKKDLLKRTNYIYKGRIFLDNCRILNLPDGKMFGVTLKNALRLYCDTRNKWFDFCFRSSSSKLRFLNTLSAERQFCGESLFVSELDGACVDDENLSDREYFPFTDEKDGCSNTDTETSNGADLTDSMQFLLGNMSQSARTSSVSVLKESPTNIGGKQSGNTLPKKSRKSSKEQQQQQQAEYSSHSLGRRKLGNWFRKAKSTNSTPSQSPTHHPMALSLAAVNNVAVSDSSSASSPGLGYHHQRTLSALSTGSGTTPSSMAKGKSKDNLMTQSSIISS